MAPMTTWACVVLHVGGREVAVVRLRGRGAPDLAVVDLLARAQLVARRGGGRLELRDVAPEFAALLRLVGLGREVGWEAEGGEEVGVEEGMDGRDPVA
jgi:hypothetical protein